jgi:hypothetical protein
MLATFPVEERQRIETKAFQADYPSTFRSVVQVLQARGYPIIVADKELGVITTDYRMLGPSQNSEKMAFAMLMGLTHAGTLRARANAAIKRVDETTTQVTLRISPEVSSMMGRFETLEDTIRPDDYAAKVGEYFELIGKHLRNEPLVLDQPDKPMRRGWASFL